MIEKLEFKYSDLPFYFLKFWFEDIYNKPLDILAEERIFNKLQLERTMFNPYKKLSLDEIVPLKKMIFLDIQNYMVMFMMRVQQC